MPSPTRAQEFLDYLCTPRRASSCGRTPATGRWTRRCSQENEDEFPSPPGLFTIEDLGGWETVATEFFDPEDGIVAEIEGDLGVATGVTRASGRSHSRGAPEAGRTAPPRGRRAQPRPGRRAT